jgi:hypothetical protein
MGKPFNVVLVQPAGYAFSLALAEAADAFRDAMFFFDRPNIARAIRALADDEHGFREAAATQFRNFERKSAVPHFRRALDRCVGEAQ